MSVHTQIGEAIKRIASKTSTIDIQFGEVISVDLPTRTCVVNLTSGETQYELPNVGLQAAIGDGWVVVPVVGSTVLVYNNQNLQPVVIGTSDIDKVYMNASLFQFNGGTNSGLVNIVPLVEKINAIENLLNELIGKYNLHTHTGVQTGGGVSGVTTSTESTTLTPTQKSDIEDTKVTH